MKKHLTFLSVFILFALGVFHLPGCTTKSLKISNSPALAPKAPQEISIMTYNVENLFDAVHDKNREDFAYLPLSLKQTPEVQTGCRVLKGYYKRECFELDWTQELVNQKLKNVAEVILSVEGQKGPDIVILVEVENENILKDLNRQYLKNAGYQTQILIEGPDLRGIDVALLSRFPVEGKAVLHKIPYKGKTPEDQKRMNRSRGVLEVPLKLPDGHKLIVMAAHFPSQGNPRYWRTQSVEFVRNRMQQLQDEMVILGGDLNISQDEEDEVGFFEKDLSSVGLVSHLVGCQKCDGTHEYRSTWSFLDALVFSKSLGEEGKAPYQLDKKSIDIVKFVPNQIYKGRSPKRFNKKTGEGVSDHFPLYARIHKRVVPAE